MTLINPEPVACLCGRIHEVDDLRPEDDGRVVQCENCGRQYRVRFKCIVYLVDAKGEILKPPKNRKR